MITIVLSDPEVRVKTVEVFVDHEGHEHDKLVPGSKRVVIYHRDRSVFYVRTGSIHHVFC